jgi:hypothetical protein
VEGLGGASGTSGGANGRASGGASEWVVGRVVADGATTYSITEGENIFVVDENSTRPHPRLLPSSAEALSALSL